MLTTSAFFTEMSDSKADPDQNEEQKEADVTATEGKEMTTVESTAVPGSADSVVSEPDSVVKPDVSNMEPPSDLEQKIIKQVEVSNSIIIWSCTCYKQIITLLTHIIFRMFFVYS